MSSWCTIESDPGVFTELITSIGVVGVEVEELYDLDLDHLLSLVPVYGLIFLFKWESGDIPDINDGRQLLSSSEEASHIFFARQMIHNACATQAIINILLNNPEIQLGKELSEFKSFTMDLPADMRGEAIGNSDLIRTAHNAFARPEPFVFEEKKDESGEAEDAFHFIGYVPIQGTLYELDGLKLAPISLGTLSTNQPREWLEKAKNSIQKRVDKYAEKEIRFSLLAIVKNRKQAIQEQLQSIQERKEQLQKTIADEESKSNTAMDTSNDDDDNAASSHAVQLSSLLSTEQDLQRQLQEEESKHAKWKAENIRRKHNYVPFIFNLLKLLAEKGKLSDVVEQAAKVTADRNARAQLNKQKRKDVAKANNKEPTADRAAGAATAAGTGSAPGAGTPGAGTTTNADTQNKAK